MLLSQLMESPNTILFHGTTILAWSQKGSFDLYLTRSRDDAENYAEETSMSEGGVEEGSQPIVIEFNLEDMVNLPGVTLEPDWGWLDGIEFRDVPDDKLPDWKESLERVGSFVISGFNDKHKKLGRITKQ